MIEIAIKGIIVAISCIGMWECIERKTGVNKYFLPSIAIAFQGVILFFAGILNILWEVTYLFLICGFVLFIFFCIKDKELSWLKSYTDYGFLFLGFSIIIYGLFVKGKVFSNFDNFSHWAIVVKKMLETNRFPNYVDTIIQYQQYPLGTATIVYYFSRLISTKESIQMLAQVYMGLTCILPVFSLIKKNKIPSMILVVVMTNLFFVYNNSPTSLYVDGYLALAFCCVILFISLYRINEEAREWSKSICILIAVYMSQLILIKSSAVFFVTLVYVQVFIHLIREKRKNGGGGKESYSFSNSVCHFTSMAKTLQLCIC